MDDGTLPVERTAEAKRERAKPFNAIGPNGNGYLSLAEVNKGCRDVLGLHDVFKAKKKVIIASLSARASTRRRVSWFVPSQLLCHLHSG